MPASSPDEAGRPKIILRVVPPPPPEPPPGRRLSWRDVALAACLTVGGLALAVVIVSGGLADTRTKSDPASALRIRPNDAAALARRAEQLLETGRRTPEVLEAASGFARQALRRDPLQGSAYRSLALIAGMNGDKAAENRLMTVAGDHMKRDIAAVSWLIDDRIASGRLAEAMERADGLLRAWPVSMRSRLGRQLTTIAASQGGAAMLARLLDSDPPWRSAFLINMAKSGDNPGAAMSLFTAMSAGRRPPSEAETGALVNRLVHDDQFQAAFLVWAQLLPQEGIRSLADPYDGGFEGLPGAPPFNWALFSRGGTVVEMSPAPQGEGQALYIRFSDASPPPALARQLLALAPGRHLLSGRWRGEGLGLGRPLVWSLRCAERGVAMTGKTGPLSGTTGWTAFSTPIEVPQGCTAQWLSLAAPGRGRLDGEAWFDDLKISR